MMHGILGSTSTFHNPLLRGMFSYAVVWPACSIAQDYLENGVSLYQANWARASRFGVFGSLCMAPVWHHWIKYTNKFFIGKSFSMAIKRSVFEQLTYSPLATMFFYFGMSVLERKSLDGCIQEVEEKFWPTYKVGLFYWPMAQTINFYFVAKKNRLVFLSAASFVWMMFMAHMKQDTDTSLLTKNTPKETKKSEEPPPEDPPRSISFFPIVNAELEKEQTAITYLGVGSEENKETHVDDPQLIPTNLPQVIDKKKIETFVFSDHDAAIKVSEVENISNMENMSKLDNAELVVESDIARSITPCFAIETIQHVENVISPVKKEEKNSVPAKTQNNEKEALIFEVIEAKNVENKNLSGAEYMRITDVVEKSEPVETVGVVEDAAFKTVLIENEDVLPITKRELLQKTDVPVVEVEVPEPDMTEEAQFYDRPWNYL